MSYVRSTIGLLLLLISLSGYAIVFYRRYHVKAAFIPVVVSSAIGISMFTAGLVNLLPEMAFFLLVLGIGLSVYAVRSGGGWKYLPAGGLLFCVLSGILLSLQKMRFAGWDNFSHWALVVKTMLRKDSFPNFLDSVITFQSYPTGSSSFIYFVCKIVGNSEGTQFFAQNILLVSSLLCFWAFVDRKDVLKNVFAFALSFFLLSYNEYVNGLMVDSLLPILGFAGVMILFYYRNDIRKGILLILPICCLLVEVKNSGIFFVALLWVMAPLISRNRFKNRRDTAYLSLLVILPVLYLFLWKKHVSMVFEQGLSSLHAMSVRNLSGIFKEKTAENIQDIVTFYLSKVFSVTQNRIWIFFSVLVLAFFYLGIRKESYAQKLIKKFILASAGVYLLWHISLMATYLCSMPLEEAMRLASYERYHKTILVYLTGCGGFLTLLLMDQVDKARRSLKKSSMVIVSLGMLLLGFHSMFASARFYQSSTLRREKMSTILEKKELLPGSSYLIYTKDTDNGYLYFVGRYEFDSTAVVLVNDETMDSFTDWDAYAYFLMLDENRPLEEEVAGRHPSITILTVNE